MGRIVAVTVLLLASASVALADPDPKAPAEYSPWTVIGGGIVGATSGTGFAIWIAWYLITRVLPARELAAATEREASEKRATDKFEAQEKRHADHMSTTRNEDREDMREAWKINKENADLFKAALERIMDRVDGVCKYKKEG